MKRVTILAAAILTSMTASAIAFVTEADVCDYLKAEKVIEISKYSVESLITPTECKDFFYSRSARAYIVKKDNQSALYLTDEKLAGLTKCVSL